MSKSERQELINLISCILNYLFINKIFLVFFFKSESFYVIFTGDADRVHAKYTWQRDGDNVSGGRDQYTGRHGQCLRCQTRLYLNINPSLLPFNILYLIYREKLLYSVIIILILSYIFNEALPQRRLILSKNGNSSFMN